MASADKISSLRGLRDVFSAEYSHCRQIEAALEQHLGRHSYLPMDFPILENTELYLRKSGEDIAARLYEFNFKSRRIALRPEVTASVLRAYVEHLQDEPLPLRIQYSGPVFRYEKPQQNRYRQFKVIGAEMLGAGGIRADAEMLYLACSGLEAIGIRDYRLVIGTTDVLGGFLQKLGLRQQLLNFLLRNMENLRKHGMDHVVKSLGAVFPEFEFTAEDPSGTAQTAEAKSQGLINVLREMTDQEAQQAIADFLHSLNIRIAANRDKSEVIDRLLHKIREDEQGPKLQIALNYMQRLSACQGPPAAVLADARALAAEFQLDTSALTQLDETLAVLGQHGDLAGEVRLDLGLNRGLNYYTGLMFEIHCQTAVDEEIQLCGGGRYDNLVSILGGNEPSPALGFAYGLERIASVLDATDAPSLSGPAVYMIPIADEDFAAAYQIAGALRARDIVVEVSIDGRSLRRSLKHADRRGVALVIIIGESERANQAAILRDMRTHQEWQIPFAGLPTKVEELLEE